MTAQDHIATLGLLEVTSIARGLVCVDQMVKKAPVDIIRAESLGAGKFLIIVTGDEASLELAVEAGRQKAADLLVAEHVIPQISNGVVEALRSGHSRPQAVDSLAIVEWTSLCDCIRAADVALKTTDVHLVELRLGADMGGKAFFVIEGDLGDIEASLVQIDQTLGKLGSLVAAEVIARPHGTVGFLVGSKGVGPCC